MDICVKNALMPDWLKILLAERLDDPFVVRTIAGVALLIFVLGGLLAVAVFVPNKVFNYGFGPDWDCENPGQGGPVCVKHPPAPKAN